MEIYVDIVLLFSVWLDASTSLKDKTLGALMGVLMMTCRTTGAGWIVGCCSGAGPADDGKGVPSQMAG
jgi:hypothetical protein